MTPTTAECHRTSTEATPFKVANLFYCSEPYAKSMQNVARVFLQLGQHSNEVDQEDGKKANYVTVHT